MDYVGLLGAWGPIALVVALLLVYIIQHVRKPRRDIYGEERHH
jgi:hypothetical protein